MERQTQQSGAGGLVDRFGRRVSYLRLSVTDRCNFRCVYCMPEEGVALRPSRELLSYEEIERVVGALAACGVERVRVTGGEPLVRKELPRLIARLNAIPGIREVVMTTNGTLLRRDAAALREAGLRSVTVSVDSLNAARFAQITRGGDLGRVLDGIDAAEEAGLSVRINTVVVRGVNDDELLELAGRALRRRWLLRFIEFMPIGAETIWSDLPRGGCVPAAEIRAVLGARWRLRELGMTTGAGPARYLNLDGPDVPSGDGPGVRHVGIISAVTECFCSACNRIRLTPQGGLRACLADDRETSLRDLMRGGASDQELRAAVRRALGAKEETHDFDIDGAQVTRKQMVSIGG
ncbi:MAG: GTP 3',8-cyclase MoaA [Myxococcales bacterium]|nr:GTP 3',8-cyclase MoaA [Myxococcales bacterium]